MNMSITAKNIMNNAAVVFSADLPITAAMEQLLSKQLTCAPVCDANGALLGMVSSHEIMVNLWCKDYHLAPAQTLSEILNQDVISVDPNESLANIIELLFIDKAQLYPVNGMGFAMEMASLSLEQRAKAMKVHAPQALPVLDNGALVGMISHLDLLAALHVNNEQSVQVA